MRFFNFLILLVLIIVVGACGTFARTNTQPSVDHELIERGIEIYRSNYCGACHTLTIANTHGTFGPNHDLLVESATSYIKLKTYSGTATTLSEYIRESILNPTIFYTPGFEASNHHMPAFTNLSDSDVDILVYMLLHPYDGNENQDRENVVR